MSNFLIGVLSEDLMDFNGALELLSQRLGSPYNVDTFAYHVRKGNLKSYCFENGQLVLFAAGGGPRKFHVFVKEDVESLPLTSKIGMHNPDRARVRGPRA